MGLALPHELTSSDNQRIYELVVRHFLASISPDATFLCTKAKFVTPSSSALGGTSGAGSSSAGGTVGAGTTFTLRGKKELLPGFLQIYRTCIGLSSYSSSTPSGDSYGAEADGEEEGGEDGGGGLLELPELEKGRAYRIAALKARQGATTPPGNMERRVLLKRKKM